MVSCSCPVNGSRAGGLLSLSAGFHETDWVPSPALHLAQHMCLVNPTSPQPHCLTRLTQLWLTLPSLPCLCTQPIPHLCSFPWPSQFPCPSAFSLQLMPPALLEHNSMGKLLCKGAAGWINGFSDSPPAGLCCG